MANKSPWRSQSPITRITAGSESEMDFRVNELLKRGYTILEEPVQVNGLVVEHHYDYSDMDRRKFRKKEYHDKQKWVCKMKPPSEYINKA